MSHESLPRAFGEPVLRARIRCTPADFEVDEVLGFEPDGQGEHLFLRVEKVGANTAWVAAQLARWAGVKEMEVGYAGLKDRHALTRQTFSIQLPGREPPAEFPSSDEFRVLSAVRHGRKLQRGALRGNAFRLLLREVRGEPGAIETRLRQIAERGVPNFFGEQRFGRGGGNVAQARALFAGKRMRRDQASILISAVRSQGFNSVLTARIEAGCWDAPVEGDVFMLQGSHSVFGPEALTEELVERCRHGDLHPTGALWGQGDPRTAAEARGFDQRHGLDDGLLAGLAKAGLRHERRALRLPVGGLQWRWLAPDQLELRFDLPAGAYATSVLHELGETDAPERVEVAPDCAAERKSEASDEA